MDPVIFFRLELNATLLPWDMRDHVQACYPNIRVFVEASMDSAHFATAEPILIGYANPAEYTKAKTDLTLLGRLIEIPLTVKLGIQVIDTGRKEETMDALEALAAVTFDLRNPILQHPSTIFSPLNLRYICGYMDDFDEFEKVFNSELRVEEFVDPATKFEVFELKCVRGPNIPKGLEHLIDMIVYRRV